MRRYTLEDAFGKATSKAPEETQKCLAVVLCSHSFPLSTVGTEFDDVLLGLLHSCGKLPSPSTLRERRLPDGYNDFQSFLLCRMY